MRFTIFQDSHIGGRKVNQDRLAYSYNKDVLLMVIADGMGGHARGEIAAEIAVNTITNRFQQEGARGMLRRPKEFLESACRTARHAGRTQVIRGSMYFAKARSPPPRSIIRASSN
jgi:PPM family protein phosphatase